MGTHAGMLGCKEMHSPKQIHANCRERRTSLRSTNSTSDTNSTRDISRVSNARIARATSAHYLEY